MLCRVNDPFERLYGRPADVRTSAPGRVNLIGEHTDYNDGFVLPTAIPQRTHVVLAGRDDGVVRAFASEMNSTLEYRLGEEEKGRGWLDYVQGVTSVLAGEGMKLRGFDAVIRSDVPVGSGLSSSAALLVATMRALRELCDLQLDDVRIAQLSQKAENGFVGAHVGIMDQMACSLADEHQALFLDTQSLSYERIPLPDGADLVVLNSGVEHSHAGGDYNTRRAECERAAAALDVRTLREVGTADLERINSLPEPLNRRARHVITENQRVLDTVAAMHAGNLERIGELFYASHASMRDDYQVSVPEIDLIVELARERGDVFGARLTGGGFGGSVVMLAREGAGRQAGEEIAREYAGRSGRSPKVLTPA
jgi:galactokinase